MILAGPKMPVMLAFGLLDKSSKFQFATRGPRRQSYTYDIRAAFRGQLVKAENHYFILYFDLEISDVYNNSNNKKSKSSVKSNAKSLHDYLCMSYHLLRLDQSLTQHSRDQIFL